MRNCVRPTEMEAGSMVFGFLIPIKVTDDEIDFLWRAIVFLVKVTAVIAALVVSFAAFLTTGYLIARSGEGAWWGFFLWFGCLSGYLFYRVFVVAGDREERAKKAAENDRLAKLTYPHLADE